MDVEKKSETSKVALEEADSFSGLFIGKGKVLGYRKAREGVGGAEGKQAACSAKSGSARK